jgi:ankyrin repeat protein
MKSPCKKTRSLLIGSISQERLGGLMDNAIYRVLSIGIFFLATLVSCRTNFQKINTAIQENDLDRLKRLLEDGVDANTKSTEVGDGAGTTPLMVVASSGNLEAANILLQARANANASTDRGRTALMLAVENHQPRLVKLLIGSGANLNAVADTGESALTAAVDCKDKQMVALLLNAGANPNVPSDRSFKKLPVVKAHDNDSLEILDILLEKADPDISLKQDDNMTILMFAAKEGKTKLVRKLLEHGANARATDNSGLTALQSASKSGKEESVKMLLAHLCVNKIEDVRGAAEAVREAIPHASKSCIPILSERLEKLNAQIKREEDRVADEKRTAAEKKRKADEKLDNICKALRSLSHRTDSNVGDTADAIFPEEMVTTFLESKEEKPPAGYVPDYSKYRCIVHLASNNSIGHSVDKYGKVKLPMYLFVQSGKDPVSRRERCISYAVDLFNHGPTETALGKPGTRITFKGNALHPFSPVPWIRVWQGSIDVDPTFGLIINEETPKMERNYVYEMARGEIQKARAAIDGGADINEKTTDGITALQVAAQLGDMELVNALLDKKADPNIRNDRGMTALLVAAEAGQHAVVEKLIESGATIEDRDSGGFTPLMLAVASGSKETVEVLIRKGADVNHAGRDGRTALFIAVLADNEKSALPLLEAGTKTEARMQPGNVTPLIGAVLTGAKNCVGLLLDHGADPGAKADDGLTAQRAAQVVDRKDIESLILSHLASVRKKGQAKSIPLKKAAVPNKKE